MVLIQLIPVQLVRGVYTFCISFLVLLYVASGSDFSSWLAFILLAILVSSLLSLLLLSRFSSIPVFHQFLLWWLLCTRLNLYASFKLLVALLTSRSSILLISNTFLYMSNHSLVSSSLTFSFFLYCLF